PQPLLPSAPPSGGGRRADRRRRSSAPRGAIAGGLAAVVLLAAGGIWLATRDGGGDGAKDAPEARLLHKVPMPKGLSKDDPVSVAGMWTTDRNFVKGDVRKIVGYPLAGGSAQWEIPLGGEVCWASPRLTEDDRTAIVFKGPGKDATCTRVGLLDLKQHKLLWQREAKDEYGSAESFDEVTIGGGTVAASAHVGDGGAAWTLDGRPLWRPNGDSDCQDIGYAGGDKLVAVTECGDADTPPLNVRTLDPRTGEAKSTYRLPAGTGYAHVVSTDPLVVGTLPDDDEDDSGAAVSGFLAIDDSAAQGRLRSRFGTPGKTYESDCDLSQVEGCRGIVVSPSADALFMATAQNTEAATFNEVVAFDLKTGRPAARIPGVPDANLRLLGLDEDGTVLAYQQTQLSGEGGGVWRIDPRTHRRTQLLRNSADDRDVEAAFEAGGRYQYAAGHLYMGESLVSAPDPEDTAEHPLAAVFGRG
ncbi:PQQ-binding-like beta-propeller repeat protein, partial [Streptomyces palmae]|uniref:PQQ-binding-like beta-propeller repeat protein n=2 Tax=Streptomyces palmae TaxID=1701085 RepID=UPI001ADFD91F